MSDLKPCPFCGGPVEIERTIDGRKWFGVVCRNTRNLGGSCAIQQRPSATEEAAIKRWNSRQLEEAKDARIAELEEFTKYCSGFLGCEDTRDSMALHSITIMTKELLAKGGE